jgi:photosystem II stability/assembly factor-like uncharacterized protein
MRTLASRSTAFLAFCLFHSALLAQTTLTEDLLSTFTFRNLGAYRAGVWVSSIAVPANPGEKHKNTFFVAPRNGGVWKTDNNGTTFKPVFDTYGVNAIGCLQIAPSNSDIVWVGTGDAYNSRSSYAGNGIYKSTDGGESFTNMGLRDSHHLAKILVHPQNPDIVYAASMGHLFSANAARGVFKTIDGGKTWKQVLFVNDNTGVIDLVMNPKKPDMLFAATYEKYRYGWHFEAGGIQSAVYRSTDGGMKWSKLKNGLPEGTIGRIGLTLCLSKPDVVYALVENLNPKDSIKELKTEGMMNTARDTYYDQLKGGEMYRSNDDGNTWKKVSDPKFNLSSKAAYSFNQVAVDPIDPELLYVLSATMHISRDGGKTWTGFERGEEDRYFTHVFGDYRTIWIDPKDSRHVMIGSDGGLYVSYDKGKTAEHLYNIPAQEVYSVGVDGLNPYNIYCGLQDHEAWRGPSNSWAGQITLEDWAVVGISDGMYCQPDMVTNRWFYTTGQFGTHQRVNLWTGQRVSIAPTRPKEQSPYRFTWTTPIILSPHDESTIYTAGEVLLKSEDRGNHWTEISPDLTTNDPKKKNGRGHIQYCTITTISESPIKPDVLWVGTDDGKVHVSRNGGEEWTDCTEALTNAGAPSHFWVTRVFASNKDVNTAYVTKSGFVFDDFHPVIMETTDGGKSWKDIQSNLPNESVNVIWEDRENPSLLFVGTDGGAYASIDGGEHWARFKSLPPLPVKDLVVQPRENDLVLGTYGRGCYVTHIGPLKSLTNVLLNDDVVLFPVKSKPQMNFSEQRWWGNRELMGNKHLSTPNEFNGFEVFFFLKTAHQSVKMEFRDSADSVKSVVCESGAGLHKKAWAFGRTEPGEFEIKLIVDDKDYETKASILPRLLWPVGNQEVHRQSLKE